MARPKEIEPKQQFTIMLKPSIVEEIEKLAEKAELSRSQLMANMIDMALDDLRLLEKMGLITAVKAGRKVINTLLEKYKKTQEVKEG